MDDVGGYWHIEVDDCDREKIALSRPTDCTSSKLCLSDFPQHSTFYRVMDSVLADLKCQSCLVYLEDVAKFPRYFDEQLRRLQAVLHAIKTGGLPLKPSKCSFAYSELKFLGHDMRNEAVRPDPKKERVLAEFSPRPCEHSRILCILLAVCSRFIKPIRAADTSHERCRKV